MRKILMIVALIGLVVCAFLLGHKEGGTTEPVATHAKKVPAITTPNANDNSGEIQKTVNQAAGEPAFHVRLPSPRWRPMRDLDLAAEFPDATGISLEKCAKAKAAFARLRLKVDELQAENAVVAPKTPESGNNHYIFLPTGGEKWQQLEKDFRNQLDDALGKDAAGYVMSASKLDFEALTGAFGTIPRVVEIAHTGFPAGIGNQWNATLLSGRSAAAYAYLFPEEHRNDLRIAYSQTPTAWSAIVGFNNNPPDFIKSLVHFN